MSKINIRERIKLFKENTWVSLFEAIEQEWILLWMWFVSDELELAETLTSNLMYWELIDKLEKIYVQRLDSKKYRINTKEVINAIKVSIKNSIVWIRMHKRETRYSWWLLDKAKASSICQKYDNVLNPLIYMVLEDTNWLLIRSIFQDRRLNLKHHLIKNWVWNIDWVQKYRKWEYLANKWMYHVYWCEKIMLDIYHPIVWHLLDNNSLDKYLTDSALNEINDFIEWLKNKLINKDLLKSNFSS